MIDDYSQHLYSQRLSQAVKTTAAIKKSGLTQTGADVSPGSTTRAEEQTDPNTDANKKDA